MVGWIPPLGFWSGGWGGPLLWLGRGTLPPLRDLDGGARTEKKWNSECRNMAFVDYQKKNIWVNAELRARNPR